LGTINVGLSSHSPAAAQLSHWWSEQGVNDERFMDPGQILLPCLAYLLVPVFAALVRLELGTGLLLRQPVVGRGRNALLRVMRADRLARSEKRATTKQRLPRNRLHLFIAFFCVF